MRPFVRMVDRFCYAHPNFGIPNLMKFIVFGNAVVYILYLMNASVLNYLAFSPQLVLNYGQVWRVFTFLFVPNNTNPLFLLISLYLYYFLAGVLEQQWGTAKFTIFYFSGALMTVLFPTIAYVLGAPPLPVLGTYYINMSIFFAFATLYPDFQLLLFFLIPIKMKWLAWADAALFLYAIITGLFSHFPISALLPAVALFNYLLFFWGDFFALLPTARRGARRAPKPQHFRQAARKTQQRRGYLHKCTVCGRTDTENPSLEFRYCSRCNGYHCYCADHINQHTHIQ